MATTDKCTGIALLDGTDRSNTRDLVEVPNTRDLMEVSLDSFEASEYFIFLKQPNIRH